ncbi:MAG TPA: hypothetical protein VFS07_07970 [Gemmatimonadales bacterium]|nr:hypothetical protein [Gemmatimonadales bacterium]
MRHVAWVCWAVVIAAPATAQVPALGVPRGQLRVEVSGGFGTAGESYVDGALRPLRADWNAMMGSAWLPALADAESRVRALTGDASYQISLGRSTVAGSTTLSEGRLGMALGLTGRITLFGAVPVVRRRAETRLASDSATANAGFNPADPAFGTSAGASQTTQFFGQFDAALGTLAQKLANGDYDSDPATKTLAQQTLADGTALRGALYGLLQDPATAATFVPTDSSAAGQAIRGSVDALQTTLSASLGVSGFTTDPALAAARFGGSDYLRFVTSVNGPVRALYRGDESRGRLGDMELGATVTLLDRWRRRGPGYRVAATGLVRLPTAVLDRTDDFFDYPTGDAQLDVEGRIAADLRLGRVGARLSGGYNLQNARARDLRVTRPDQPLAYADRLARVSVDPGDEWQVGVEPFVALAPGFALLGGVFRSSHGTDAATYVGAGPLGVAASDLTVGSARTATVWQAGLTYSSAGLGDGRGTPVDASWRVQWVTGSSEGRVEKLRRMGFEVRWFYRVW